MPRAALGSLTPLLLAALGAAGIVAAFMLARDTASNDAPGGAESFSDWGFDDWADAPGSDSFGAAWPTGDVFEDVAIARENPVLFWASIMADENVKLSDRVFGSVAGSSSNRAAFLALIREFESGNQYNVIYGGDTFASYADHPKIYVPIRIAGYEGKFSSAAGAYQFLWKTWDNLRNRLGLMDFSPRAQDVAALELLREIGALEAIDQGDFDGAMRIASSQWASLPYSVAKQNPQSVEKANIFLASILNTSDLVA